MAKPTVYIETTIPSFFTARPSSDVDASAKKLATIQWWDEQRFAFDLVTSNLVIEEAERGHPEASKRRLDFLEPIALLVSNEHSLKLAQYLVEQHALPTNSLMDAHHVALSAIFQVDYLLTWNCKHIANATMRDKIALSCEAMGFVAPKLCTPAELIDLTGF
ncbi:MULTISPECIES: type II toxin-antitoxin system VapC family toxin [unclassified Moraxella]|uniref:type II toxin-antitoxin system VapC family toxin n=1 Tax=unclassified Moraxella TaxID=2685852 RepID=UPI003AF93BEE